MTLSFSFTFFDLFVLGLDNIPVPEFHLHTAVIPHRNKDSQDSDKETVNNAGKEFIRIDTPNSQDQQKYHPLPAEYH